MPPASNADRGDGPRRRLRAIDGADAKGTVDRDSTTDADAPDEPRRYGHRVDEERIAQARQRLVATIGRHINDLRRHRYTLGQLAAASGLSVGLLSRLENGIGNPSLASLNAIARALDVDVHTFFDAVDNSAALVRHRDRPVIRNVSTKVECELLAPALSVAQRAGLVAVLIQLPRGQRDDEWIEADRSSRDQLEFVLRGTVSIHVESEVYQLEEGDAIMFDASRRHKRQNLSQNDSALIFCVSREIDFI